MERIRPNAAPKTAKFTARGLDNALMWAGPVNQTPVDCFVVPPNIHPPRATPRLKSRRIAQDDTSLLNANIAWAGSVIQTSFNQGLQFLGYPYLSMLTQRQEYRVPTETIAGEMTRKWIKFTAIGDDEKKDRIKQLEDRFEELEVKDHFRKVAEQDSYFGRGHIFLDFGKESREDRDELTKPIGDGKNHISRAKVGPALPLERINTVEAVWAYPTSYDSVDPLSPDWYNPQQWFVMGKQIHISRLLLFVGREVPDLLKPAYSFGGLSLSQIMKPTVDAWLRTRGAVNDLINAFVVWGLKTNLAESLAPQGDMLFKRIALFKSLMDNRGLMVTDKDTEEFSNITAPLGSLDALQGQSQEHMASACRIPLVKLFGIQPAGLNASSEGEIRVFYDTIHEYQEKFFRKNLTRIMHFVMLSLWGEVDEEINFSFEPLWSLDEKQEAEVRKTDAETGQVLIDAGVISQEEERKRVAEDPGTPYAGLDKNEMPDLRAEETEGLEPEGGRPDPNLTGSGPEGPGEAPGNENEPGPSMASSKKKSNQRPAPGEESTDEEPDEIGPIRRTRIDKAARLVRGQAQVIPMTPGREARNKRIGKLSRIVGNKAAE